MAEKVTECRADRLRPTQLRARRESAPLAYLPLGILEWHGLHNPIGLDGLKAHALCVRVAERAGGVVFPTLYWSSPPATHNLETDHYDPAYPAGYGLPEQHFTQDTFGFGDRLGQWELFNRVVDQSLRVIARYGFKAVLVLCGHYPLVHGKTAANSFRRERNIPLWMGHEGEAVEPPDGDHAAQWETSLMWALDPEVVAEDQWPGPGEPNPPGVRGKPVADITPELAERNLERSLAGLAAIAEGLLAEAARG